MGEQNLVPIERIERAIVVLREHRVMLDEDLAIMYEVETRELIHAVKRNVTPMNGRRTIEHFPECFHVPTQ